MIKILKYGEVEKCDIFARTVNEIDVAGTVSEIIGTVRKDGDSALFMYCEKFDKAVLKSLEVSKEEIEEAVSEVPSEFLEILKNTLLNCTIVHLRYKENGVV